MHLCFNVYMTASDILVVEDEYFNAIKIETNILSIQEKLNELEIIFLERK